MNIRLALMTAAAVAGALASCAPAQSCKSNEDCLGYGQCIGGYCYAIDSGSGTGGGNAGGGSGGGNTGGGSSGGMTTDPALRITAPMEGAAFTSTAVSITVEATPATYQPATVNVDVSPLDGSTGGMRFVANRSGTSYTGSGTLPGDGEYRMVASNGNVTSAAVTFRIDSTPPQVELVLVAPPARQTWENDAAKPNAYKKNETVQLQAQSDDPVTIAASDFDQTVAPATCTGTCPAKHTCACFSLDLNGVALPMARGDVNVTLGALSNAVGLSSTPVTKPIPVTRLKWARDVLPNNARTLSPLVVTPAGQVVVATGDPMAGSGTVVAFAPSGAQAWEAADGGCVTAGPALTATHAFAGMKIGGDSTMRRLKLSDGTWETGSYCYLNGTTDTFSGMALGGASGAEFPVSVRGGNLTSARGSFDCPSATLDAGTYPLGATPRLVARQNGAGTEVFVGTNLTVAVDKLSFNPAWAAEGRSGALAFTVSGLFMVGTTVGGGGGDGAAGGVFATNGQGMLSGAPSTYAAPTSVRASAAVVGGTSAMPWVGYGDSAGNATSVGLTGSTLTTTRGTSMLGGPLNGRAMVLGEGGKGYAVGADGAVRVFSQATMQQDWAWQGAIEGSGITELALDVGRDATGAKSCTTAGTLYVASLLPSTTARVYALLVDSKGLDRDAPWPKWQHDNGNSGNPATSNAAWTCPP